MNEEMQKELEQMRKVADVFSVFSEFERQQQESFDRLRECVYAILQHQREE